MARQVRRLHTMHGTIAELIPDRGFGFISDMDGRRYFFHRGALMGVDFDDLAPGQSVEFMARPPESGDEPGEHPRAVNIRLAPDTLEAPDHERLPRAKTVP